MTRLALVASGLIVLGQAQPGAAQEDPGHFEVRSASVELDSGVYYLNAWIEFRLSTEARAALQSGLPITIQLDVEFLRVRRFWMDAGTANLTQKYQLEYHALSERYIVRNLNSGDQASYATLFSALNVLGKVDRLPLIDATLLDSDARYDIRIRAVLDTQQLPGPLHLLAFWRRDWSIASDWYRWRLERE